MLVVAVRTLCATLRVEQINFEEKQERQLTTPQRLGHVRSCHHVVVRISPRHNGSIWILAACTSKAPEFLLPSVLGRS